VVINHAEILDNKVAVVEIDGPLDSHTSPDFEEYINHILAKSMQYILFDAGRMTYVSSEGIGLLLFLQRKISEANGFFVIFNLPGEILTLYRLLGFDKVFRIAESRAEALQIMDRQMELRESGMTEEPEPEPEEPAPAPVRKPAEPAAPVTLAAAPQAREEDRSSTVEVACASCGVTLRVEPDSDYICPNCNAEFSMIGRGVGKSAPSAETRQVDLSDFGALIVECARCKSLIRIKKPGAFRCPDCGARFYVGDDQTIAFD
jgi:anti-anti-sigma factor